MASEAGMYGEWAGVAQEVLSWFCESLTDPVSGEKKYLYKNL